MEQEQIAFRMRALFEKYGYRRFEMSKFEEYDFYAENRSFLGSEHILTFTGLDGKLMALKPDVTLSIVKNSRGSRETADRVYYHENVYRARRGDEEYREILQAGLEYIGEADAYAVLEVVLLAVRSLELIHGEYLLDVSHGDFAAGLLDETGMGFRNRKRILRCIREKNSHEIHSICKEAEVSAELAGRLETLAGLYGRLNDMLPAARALVVNEKMERAYKELAELGGYLKDCGYDDWIHLDFSIINDLDYYNGITFQGFVDGIPGSILRGGRYDNLVRKLGKNADAIGFAVYLDLLERFGTVKREYDTDVLLLYGGDSSPADVAKAADRIAANGESVVVRRADSGESAVVRRADSGESAAVRQPASGESADVQQAAYGDIRYRRILDMRTERMGDRWSE